MNSNKFILNYPEQSGFGPAEINFFRGNPDLQSVFLDSDTCGKKRLFVTDTTIIKLPSVKDFFAGFKITENSSVSEPAFIAEKGSDILLVLGSGEEYKTIGSVLSIVRTALEYDFERNCTFIAVGGGVICDMTGFAASIYKRGVNAEFVPTTLLAMVDAAVGGKTGCDFEGYKNMIGAFHPATKLYVWPSFVQSLIPMEYRSGLAEAVKTALLFSPELYSVFTDDYEKIAARDEETLDLIITTCVKAKARIVEKDLKEKAERALLNLGHTFGHAMEAIAGLGKISHGEAVAWGMGRALDLGVLLGITDSDYCENTKQILSSLGYDMNALPAVMKDSGESHEETVNRLIAAMHKDKKNSSSKVKVILQKKLCENIITEADDEMIEKVL